MRKGQKHSEAAIAAIKASNQLEWRSKFNWDNMPSEFWDKQIGNRKLKFITYREFKTGVESGKSIEDFKAEGISKHLIAFYASCARGDIPFESVRTNLQQYIDNGMSLDNASKVLGVSREALTFLRMLFDIKSTNWRTQKRRKEEIQAKLTFEEDTGRPLPSFLDIVHAPVIDLPIVPIVEPQPIAPKIEVKIDLSTLKSFVVCLICGKQLGFINQPHLTTHGVSKDQYLERFPNAELTSELTLARRSASVKTSWVRNPNQGRTGSPLGEESRKKLSEKLTGHSVSEEARKKISETGMGREPWNKDLTKEDDPRVLSISKKMSAYNAIHMTEEKREKISQTLKKRYADGMKVPNSKSGFRTDLGMYFRSTWEANFARVLILEQKLVEYEVDHIVIKNKGEDDIELVYVTDFKVGANHYVEVKGHAESKDWWPCNCKRCSRDKKKIAAAFDLHPELIIEIFGKKEYKELTAKYRRLIDAWEE